MGDKDQQKGAPKEKNDLKDSIKGGMKGSEKTPTPPGQKK